MGEKPYFLGVIFFCGRFGDFAEKLPGGNISSPSMPALNFFTPSFSSSEAARTASPARREAFNRPDAQRLPLYQLP